MVPVRACAPDRRTFHHDGAGGAPADLQRELRPLRVSGAGGTSSPHVMIGDDDARGASTNSVKADRIGRRAPATALPDDTGRRAAPPSARSAEPVPARAACRSRGRSPARCASNREGPSDPAHEGRGPATASLLLPGRVRLSAGPARVPSSGQPACVRTGERATVTPASDLDAASRGAAQGKRWGCP